MYIAPNSTVNLLERVPIDISMQDTLYFPTVEKQTEYFSSKTRRGLTFNKMSYVRGNRGHIKVEANPDSLRLCNYMMYQNTSFNYKWFYAFIVGIEYISNNVADIAFVIDPMQTWFFDIVVKACFVEREHTEVDYPGSNLVPESFELGDYVTDDFDFPKLVAPSGADGETPFRTNSYCLNIVAPFNYSYGDSYGVRTPSGFYSGLSILQFPNTEGTNGCSSEQCRRVIEFIQNGNPKTQSIVCIFASPQSLIKQEGDPEKTIWCPKKITTIGSYTPKNKKLLTSPFTFLYLQDNNGHNAVYPYEYFATNSCRFEVITDEFPNPVILFVPRAYKGANWNFEEKFTLTGFPLIPWVNDSYLANLAQQATQIPTASLTAGVGALMFPRKAKEYTEGAFDNPKTGDYLGLISDTASMVTGRLPGNIGGSGPWERINDLAELKDNAALAGKVALGTGAVLGTKITSQAITEKILEAVAPRYANPLNSNGSISSSTLATKGFLNVTYTCKHIRTEFAKIIDDFFDMYGYAVHKVKVPNIAARPHWSYVKTVDCHVEGDAPASDLAAIAGCFDRGIRFWKNPDEVGNYDMDNSPV